MQRAACAVSIYANFMTAEISLFSTVFSYVKKLNSQLTISLPNACFPCANPVGPSHQL